MEALPQQDEKKEEKESESYAGSQPSIAKD